MAKAPAKSAAEKPAKKAATPKAAAAKPAASADNGENTLLLETSQGSVVIKLRPDLAPGHVERIKLLAREGFYDGIKFHRVINGFMAQTGCPKGTGTGGSKLPDLKAEFNAFSHQRGVCSMARAQSPNSANSQFFICLDDASFLDKQYTAWGEVVSGMESIDKLAKGEPPRSPDHIVSMKIG
jgi:cyclophilin family peptidyl-prolyl cis-trans isomerase